MDVLVNKIGKRGAAPFQRYIFACVDKNSVPEIVLELLLLITDMRANVSFEYIIH